MLGGGDCAPCAPRRHSGAVDIPGNRIDEDCDGADQTSLAFHSRPRLAFPAGPAIPQKPNVILITIDGLGAPRLAALGGDHPALMPNVDRFAASSKLFSHCFSQGPSTRLSFPSMFTSRFDSQLVFTYAPRIPYSIGEKERQLQDVFDDAGYDTIAVVPDVYFSKLRWPGVTRGFQRVNESPLSVTKHNAPQVTDAALLELSAQTERPVYLWVHYFDAHPPYRPIPGVQYTGSRDKDYYDAELTYLDREVGRLLDAIDQRPEPTYVILTADHSTVFHPNPESRHYHYGYDLYTATLHVPLAVRGPGIAPGRVDDLVSTMDLAPTILGLMRAPIPLTMEGTSLLPELTSAQRDPQRVLFHEYFLPEFVLRGKDPLQIVSVHDDRWNLILNRDRGTYELYDWTADYFERQDLYESLGRTKEGTHLRSLAPAASSCSSPAVPPRPPWPRPRRRRATSPSCDRGHEGAPGDGRSRRARRGGARHGVDVLHGRVGLRGDPRRRPHRLGKRRDVHGGRADDPLEAPLPGALLVHGHPARGRGADVPPPVRAVLRARDPLLDLRPPRLDAAPPGHRPQHGDPSPPLPRDEGALGGARRACAWRPPPSSSCRSRSGSLVTGTSRPSASSACSSSSGGTRGTWRPPGAATSRSASPGSS